MYKQNIGWFLNSVKINIFEKKISTKFFENIYLDIFCESFLGVKHQPRTTRRNYSKLETVSKPQSLSLNNKIFVPNEYGILINYASIHWNNVEFLIK